ncbi:membrane protein [Helicobacter pylori oki673]|nr:membrane protein [Helicobacter pylori oki673]
MRPVPLIAILIGMFSLYLKTTILSQMLLNKGILKGFFLIRHQS